MRIYLDMCCLKRPFDDQSDARIQLETTALAAILVVCNRGEHELFTSDALRFENSRNPNPERQEFAERVLAQAPHDIRHDSNHAGYRAGLEQGRAPQTPAAPDWGCDYSQTAAHRR